MPSPPFPMCARRSANRAVSAANSRLTPWVGVGERPIGICPPASLCAATALRATRRGGSGLTRAGRARIPDVPRSGTTIRCSRHGRCLSAGALTVGGHGCRRHLSATGGKAKPAIRSRAVELASLVTRQCRRRPAPPPGCIRRPVPFAAGVLRQQQTVPFPDRLARHGPECGTDFRAEFPEAKPGSDGPGRFPGQSAPGRIGTDDPARFP